MIGRLIEASARNRGLVLLVAVAVFIAGVYAMRHVKLDAIPDLTDPQVIVYTEWMGRSPTLVEDQVTYPLVTALLGAPRVVDVRAQSMFGMSFVYVIFEEGTDVYWARSRVLEYLNTARARLPLDATTSLGPDATGIGWVYQYALVDRRGRMDVGALRALQDFHLRYALTSVPGVAEVPAVGGFVQQYQVTLDPDRLRANGLTLADVATALRRANGEVGGRILEMSEREYFIRGRGYITGSADIDQAVLRTGLDGAPLRVRDVGTVRLGGDIRRGAADFNGRGETVSGIVVMRYGENALDVIHRVERKLAELAPSLPPGVEVIPVYDRSGLISRAIETLRRALTEEMIVVALVIVLFLLHLRSALLPIIALPLAVVMAFIPMYLLDIPATIMSLGGIAIAIGATVDAEIVMVEAAHKALEHLSPSATPDERRKLLADAAREVTPAIFFSLLIIAASFIPVFGLTGQAGRLFRPLAYTKTLVMLSAAVLSVTVAPALRDVLLRGRIRPESQHLLSRAILTVYAPLVYVALRRPKTTVLIGLMAVLSALPLVQKLGSEFMPPLDEGDLLYMPTTLPTISIEAAREQVQRQDTILRSFPEVLTVLGKVGRAESPTDPAPLSMVETIVQLRPQGAWRTHRVRRWYTGRTPAWLRPLLTRIQPDVQTITRDQLVAEMSTALNLPGWTSAFTQPIRNRVDMLSTGIRTPVGVKVYGTDLDAIERTGTDLERVLHGVAGTRSVLFERSVGGLYIDIVPNRDALGRYGLQVQDVNDMVEGALGGVPVTTTVEGRRRFSVNVRYAEDFRSSLEKIRAVPIALAPSQGPPSGTPSTGWTGARQIPLGAVADVRIVSGPPMIRDEAGLLVGYVYVDVDPERDVGSYVDDARRTVARAASHGELRLASGSYLRWTGQYELLADMESRMKILIPLALLVIVVLLYMQFKDMTEVLIVLLSVPFALVGSVWALWLLGYHLSTAVWVGVIALVGLAAQTGVVMIVYIDTAYLRRLHAGEINSLEDIIHAHTEGTVRRVRPKLMTVGTMLVGLVPLLWAHGSGADVMKRIAAPMVGGLITSSFLTLEIIPVIYTYWRYEQLIWRRVTAAAPSVLHDLRVSLRAVGIALVLTSGAMIARWHFASASRLLLAVAAAGVATGLTALVRYNIARGKAIVATNPSSGSAVSVSDP